MQNHCCSSRCPHICPSSSSSSPAITCHHATLTCLTIATMVSFMLAFTLIIIACVHGRPPLPPLPTKDGCFLVSPEVEVFRLEGEAVILAFPIFHRVLQIRNIASSAARFLITRSNGTQGVTYEGEGRVQQHDRQLWLLPAQASDSGEYTCSYRNETYCITGSVTLTAYESGSADTEKLSYPISAVPGENLKFTCPSLGHFNDTEQVEWCKVLGPAALRQDAAGFHGVYICRLTVTVNNRPYRVSRTILLQVQEPQEPDGDFFMTSDPDLTRSSTPKNQPPVIVSPLNGTIFESPHGSGLELFCKVLVACQRADFTAVEWLVDGRPVESSYLDALQGGRRVTRVHGGCQIELQLVVMAMTQEDIKTELKCIAQNEDGRQEAVAQLQLEDSTSTWLIVAAVALSCVLTVVSVFLYILLKSNNKRKMDGFLSRQNSSF
ncbi:hypothetical protein LDENG_00211190 [Lucifuga dentata]|nr:hypothetical protein LDENG_00211190 [Lucifuga dentata]